MRVVAGKYKGKNLASPINNDVRPTTTRIKETLFNVIQFKVQGSVCLDLFGGSGALGIECISRGSNEVYFVDNNKNSINLIHQNLKGIDGKYKVLNCDFYSALRSCYAQKLKFDLIFLDPPYKTSYGEDAIKSIIDMDLLSKDGCIIYEHGSDKNYLLSSPYYKQRTKKMGSVTAEFITRKNIAMFAGSFDPFTIGHKAVLEEIKDEYDLIVVSLLINPEKKYLFDNDSRLEIAKLSCVDLSNVKCVYSDKNAVDVAFDEHVNILIRSYRNDIDYDYEIKMAEYNRSLGYETRLMSLQNYKEISSTDCREKIKKEDYSELCSNAIDFVKGCNI